MCVCGGGGECCRYLVVGIPDPQSFKKISLYHCGRDQGWICCLPGARENITVPEGWLEIDKHYSLELCFSIEKQPETVWRGGV